MKVLTYILFLLLICPCPTMSRAQDFQLQRNESSRPQESSDRQLAFQYYRNKEYEKAAAMFQKLYDKEPAFNHYNYLLNCLLELKQLERAEDLIKKQMRRSDSYYRYHIDLGYVYTLQDKIRKADREYAGAIDNLPANKNMITQVSNAFMLRQETDWAIKTLNRGKDLIGNDEIFDMELGNIYYRSGNFSLMIISYMDYLAFDEMSAPRIKSRLQLLMNTGAGEGIRDILRTELLKRTQQNPGIRVYPEMLYWLSVQEGDYEFALIQARAIDKRFDQNGNMVFNIAGLAMDEEVWGIAIEGYNYIINSLGERSPLYYRSRTGILKAKFNRLLQNPQMENEQVEQLVKSYEKTLEEMGNHPESFPLSRNLAHIYAFHLGNYEEAARILLNNVEDPGINAIERAQSKMKLADVYLFMGEEWESSLLYAQVDKEFKNDPLGHEAKFRNAKLFYYLGEFNWAEAKLDILRSATSKLIANDAMQLSLIIKDNVNTDTTYDELKVFAYADFLFFKNEKQAALKKLDSLNKAIEGYHAIKDELVFRMAEINESLGNPEKADSLYAVVAADYSWDILCDDALYQRAQLNEKKLGRTEKAMELYKLVFTTFPESVYSIESRKRFRELRGDENL